MSNKKRKAAAENTLIFIIFSFAVGGIIGGIIWAFLRVMHMLVNFIWEYIPGKFDIPLYTIAVCLIGGVIIGIVQKFRGPCPDELNEVMAELKEKGRYPYSNILFMLFSALLPLAFGGALGPEAGLTGVIVGLCCWAGDNFKYADKNLRALTDIGVSATLGVVFRSPFFGFVEPIESAINSDDDVPKLPKSSKIVSTFAAIIAALAAFYILSELLGSGGEMPSFTSAVAGSREILFALPLLAVGIVFGLLFKVFDKLTLTAIKPIKDKRFITAMIAAVILGLLGTFFPLAMFSGEEEISKLGASYLTYSPYYLLAVAFVKVLLINVCINFGWRGGNFFPALFAGVCLGYAFSMLLGLDPPFCVMIITSALMTTMLRMPIAVSLLLLICFPAKSIIWILAAAIAASVIPLPKFLDDKSKKAAKSETTAV